MHDRDDPTSIAADEVEFRTTVLVKLAEIKLDLKHVKGTCDETKTALADHVRHDNERFGTVTQEIGKNSSGINKGYGLIAAVVVMIGVIFSIIQLMKT